MPIEVGIWRIGSELSQVNFQPLASEAKLEEILEQDLSLLGQKLMLIGRQVATVFGKFIDLLAMDEEGNLVIIELKRDKTPREVVAQTLDYASWVEGLSFDDITELYAEKQAGKNFEVGFDETFGTSPPEKLNESHQMVIVASELDSATERIINYLNDNYGVPINTVFFRHFQDEGNEYLTRTWLIDPQEAESKAKTKKQQEPWNQRDFYVSLGEGPETNWDDCRKFGFICGNGGRWYTQTLKRLFPGARVFVNIPQQGYVGVGEVIDTVKPINEFQVDVDGKPTNLLDAPLIAKEMGSEADDPERCHYLVKVKWLNSVPREDAYWEKGLFAIQHTACKMRSQFTIERLTQHFKIED